MSCARVLALNCHVGELCKGISIELAAEPVHAEQNGADGVQTNGR